MKTQLRWVALAAFAGLGAARRFAQGFKPTRPVEVVVHTGPGGGSDVLARAVALMVEKEKLLPVRMQVVNKPGGGGAVAAAYLAEKKGDPNTIGFFTGVWLTNPLMSAEAKVTLRDLTPIVAPVARAGGDRGEGRRALQDARRFHRRGEEESRAAQAIGRLDHEPRQRGAAAAAEEHRRALGVHLVSRRRRAHRGAARRPRQHDGDRARRRRASTSAPATCACSRR